MDTVMGMAMWRGRGSERVSCLCVYDGMTDGLL